MTTSVSCSFTLVEFFIYLPISFYLPVFFFFTKKRNRSTFTGVIWVNRKEILLLLEMEILGTRFSRNVSTSKPWLFPAFSKVELWLPACFMLKSQQSEPGFWLIPSSYKYVFCWNFFFLLKHIFDIPIVMWNCC